MACTVAGCRSRVSVLTENNANISFHRLAVQAQRKYAHKAYIPGPHKSDPETPEPEQVIPPQPVVVVNRAHKTAKDLLDQVSFKNLHEHDERDRMLNVRVLLKRYQPDENVPEPAPIPKKVKQALKKIKRLSNVSPMTIRTRSKAKIGESPIIKNPIIKNTRGRQLRRKLSETSTDDNQPLTYLTKTTLKNAPRTLKKAPRKKVINVNKRKVKKRKINYTTKNNSEKKTKVRRNEVRASTSAAAQNADQAPNVAIPDNAPMPLAPISLAPMSLAPMALAPMALEPEEDDSPTLQLGNDFVIRIFNCDKSDDIGQEEVNDMSDSLLRVREWVATSCEEAQHYQQENSQFKVPTTPRWRVRAPPSVCSTTVSTVAGMTSKEKALRARCPTWNYKTLSDVVLIKELVKRFCGECTRCRVMFKLDHRPLSPVLTNASDIYEFTSGIDDKSSTLPYREIPTFSNISTQADHVTKLKQIMSDKGKKIFKAALIIKNKIEENKLLLPQEDAILAQVIGILNECNAARIPERQVPLSPSIEEICAQSSRRRFSEVSSIPTTSIKRPRQCKTPALSLEILLPAPLRKSQKFSPTLEEFTESPIKFAHRMQLRHPGISLCGIKPPQNFNPPCNISDLEPNFKVTNQYIHRMLKRWGTATRQLTAIRSIQDPKIQRSPLFEGLEVDLVKLFQTVQSEDGIETCQNNPEKWQVVAQKMKLCRGKAYTKLENIYLKYLLGYNTLTQEEREKANAEVEQCWLNRDINSVLRAQQPLWRQERMRNGLPIDDDAVPSHLGKVCAEAEECVTPGRYLNYSSFEKLALRVQETYFPVTKTPSPEEVEREYLDIVMSANAHVCVYAASVDAEEHFAGFPVDPADTYSSNPWNLKLLGSSSDNLLSYLGPRLGVSSTSIHYGMMFSTSCWHMDPTSIPWIEYLHSGSPKIWYSISADQESKFRAAAEALCPFAVQNKPIWLPCDIIMIPPDMLRQYGVIVERHVQYPGEFVIVYPNTYCACIDTGMSVSEGVYFAPCNWMKTIEKIFLNLQTSCEPSLFSMEELLIAMSTNSDTPFSLLQQVHKVLAPLLYGELTLRSKMADRNIELMSPQVFLDQNPRATDGSWQIQPTGECSYCRCTLHLSRVVGVTDGQTGVCAMHGLSLFESAVSRRVQLTNVYCITLVGNTEIYEIINRLHERVIVAVQATCNKYVDTCEKLLAPRSVDVAVTLN